MATSPIQGVNFPQFNLLCDDEITVIFEFLELSDRIFGVGFVCRRFNVLVHTRAELWQIFEPTGAIALNFRTTDDVMGIVGKYPIEELHLEHCFHLTRSNNFGAFFVEDDGVTPAPTPSSEPLPRFPAFPSRIKSVTINPVAQPEFMLDIDRPFEGADADERSRESLRDNPLLVNNPGLDINYSTKPNSFPLFVKTLEGRTLELNLMPYPFTYFTHVKIGIYLQTRIPLKSQRLIHYGRGCWASGCLFEFRGKSVRPGDTLHLVLRLQPPQ